MTDILINWLNSEVKLSRNIDSINIATEFANGYLIGEILSKNQLQDDFDLFSQNRTNESKLNNFSRVEPILALLGIPFDSNVAREVMTEKHGVATRVLYQLFIALGKKQKTGLTGVAMETMRPAAPAKLDRMKTLMYKERLKHLTPRQAELNLQALTDEYREKRVQLEQTAFRMQMEEEERVNTMIQRRRQELMDRKRQTQAIMAERIAKIHAAKVDIPQPPARTLEILSERKHTRKLREIGDTQMDIEAFETRLATSVAPTVGDTAPPAGAGATGVSAQMDTGGDIQEGAAINTAELEYISPKTNTAYISKIKKKLNEDASARSEREKRRRKVLVEQMKAHMSQEEARREEMLVNRLMRQSQQERRIAVQLMHTRAEKDVIRENRLEREKQYEERRKREFQEALDREAALAKLAQEEYADDIRKEKELHAEIAARRAEEKYRRHYNLCMDVCLEMVDVACKVGEYRELTEGMVPEKLWRDWTLLFVEGKPLFPVTNSSDQPPDVVEDPTKAPDPAGAQALLDEGDFEEYQTMTQEWAPPEDCEVKEPVGPNPIVGHIINRIFHMVHPDRPLPVPPNFPKFPIKACIVGKTFSGKSDVALRLADTHRLRVLCVDKLIAEAVKAYEEGEEGAQPEDGTQPKVAELSTAGAGKEVAAGGSGKEAKDEEPEKKDEEKEVPEHPEMELSAEPSLSVRARLGASAGQALADGSSVADTILVDVVVEAIRCVPEGTGWVLDGFPTTKEQARLLEKALSGHDAQEAAAQPKSISESKNSRLAPNPCPAPPPPPPVSSIDVVIHFDALDEICIKRSLGRYQALQSGEEYHEEFRPPPEGSVTGVQGREQVVPVTDEAHDREQVQQKIVGFLDTWPPLQSWFDEFKIVTTVDATATPDQLYEDTKEILNDTVDRLMCRGKYKPLPEPVKPPTPEPTPPPREPTPPPPPPPEEPPVEETRPSSSKKGKKGSGKGKRAESESPSRKPSPGKKSRGSSAKSKKSKGKKTPEPPELEPEVLPEPPGTPPPVPGAPEYEYITRALPQAMAEVLCPQWERLETSYISGNKAIFRNIRKDRDRIIRYFYQMRKDYLAYLRRPDNKQDLVDQWQKMLNGLPDDMREDDEMKMELHQRVDDLRERLWTTCDERKEQAENERQGIMGNGWLDDRLGVVTNLHISVMQTEVDRFQDTVQLVKDYYKSMEAPIPDEIKSEWARLPLVELPATDQSGAVIEIDADAPSVQTPQEPSAAEKEKEKVAERRSPTPKGVKPRTPSGKRPRSRSKSASKKEDKVTPPPPEHTDMDMDKRRIPLIPRRRDVQELSDSAAVATPAKGADKKDKGKAKKSQGNVMDDVLKASESPSQTANMDPDERLIQESYEAGVRAIQTIVAQEETARKAAEEAEMEAAAAAAAAQLQTDKPAKGDKKGGKKGKSRSPSPQKGKGKTGKSPAPAATPLPVASEVSEEEKEMHRLKVKARDEFFAAIKREEAACKARLELVKAVSIKVINELKAKSEDVFKDMDDWLGARFLKEMEGIDQLSEILRHTIESHEKLQKQTLLYQEDFLVVEDVKTVRTPSPPPRPVPMETPYADALTVDQLISLHQQFTLVAGEGIISVKHFIDIFQEFASLTHGMESLPDGWMGVTVGQLQQIAGCLAVDQEYVDWKAFIAAACQPVSLPTTDELLEVLHRFKLADLKGAGYVDAETYSKIDLWFSVEVAPSPSGPSEPVPYNRNAHLKDALFSLFSDNTGKLPYVEMLRYFAVDQSPYEGFLRALSVTVGAKLSLPLPISSSAENGSTRPNSSPGAVGMGTAEHEYEPVGLKQLHYVLHHGELSARIALVTDGNTSADISSGEGRAASSAEEPEPRNRDTAVDMEKLQSVYIELGGDAENAIPFKVLMAHPIIQEYLENFHRFKYVDLKQMLLSPPSFLENMEGLSTRAES